MGKAGSNNMGSGSSCYPNDMTAGNNTKGGPKAAVSTAVNKPGRRLAGTHDGLYVTEHHRTGKRGVKDTDRDGK